MPGSRHFNNSVLAIPWHQVLCKYAESYADDGHLTDMEMSKM